MWFGLPDGNHANEMITQLADADHETDWGMRIISSRSAKYDGSGYHFGSVWPLFTGWAQSESSLSPRAAGVFQFARQCVVGS